jgi:hypothetical protein
MSITDASRGFPYGGIPYQELLNKLEETDMNKLDDNYKEDYHNYIRSEIIDRSLDKPFLESDKTKRDNSISKSILNLRYNGSRGKYEHPQHPELFVGFMDSDNRSLDNNPRMNYYQQQITTRMPNLEIRMGHNNDDTIHETPWTNQSLNDCRRDIQTSLKYNTKVFTEEKDGRLLNSNFVVNYDHNKKPLIYKDIVPSGLNGVTENISKKSMDLYNTSSIPFISNDIDFNSSYDNEQFKSVHKIGSISINNINHDHIKNDEQLNNLYNKTSVNAINININNSSIDHEITDQDDNIINNRICMDKKNITNNIINDIQYNDDVNLLSYKSGNNYPNINLSNHNNDVIFYNSLNNINKTSDKLIQPNINNLLEFQFNNDILYNENNIYKKHINYNNIITNSNYDFPVYTFTYLDINKHSNIPLNNSIINKLIHNIDYYDSELASKKTNNIKLNDNINIVMKNNISHLIDNTYESQLRSSADMKQENKMNTINNDTIWKPSSENLYTKSKTPNNNTGIQPIIIDNIYNKDFEITNGGVIFGKKSIRGDKYSQEISETENIYDTIN